MLMVMILYFRNSRGLDLLIETYALRLPTHRWRAKILTVRRVPSQTRYTRAVVTTSHVNGGARAMRPAGGPGADEVGAPGPE